MTSYRIQHKTTYDYAYPVATSHHSARLKPLSSELQTCQSFRLKVDPDTADLIERLDYFGNAIQMFSIQESHDKLIVESDSEVDVVAQAYDIQSLTTTCAELRSTLTDIKRSDLIDIKQFLYPTETTPTIPQAKEFGMRFFGDGESLGSAIGAMLAAYHDEFSFDPKATEINTPVSEVFSKKRGVCQDFAHSMIASLRACGISARYVSGYLLTLPPEGEERLVGADASHAWVSIYTPEAGWIEVDPTNNLICSDQHVRVAYGRDFADVSMLNGAVTGGGEHTLTVEVTMEPV